MKLNDDKCHAMVLATEYIMQRSKLEIHNIKEVPLKIAWHHF